jgi:hypothetical protein
MGDTNRYPLAGTLTANHFISITLAWDRQVELDVDADMDGEYDIGDTFEESMVSFPTPDSDDLINNLVLFLLPKGRPQSHRRLRNPLVLTALFNAFSSRFPQLMNTRFGCGSSTPTLRAGRTMRSLGGTESHRHSSYKATTTVIRSSTLRITTLGDPHLDHR